MSHPSDFPETCCPTCGGNGVIGHTYDCDIQVGGATFDPGELLDRVKADARALWAVRVLDAGSDWETYPGPRHNRGESYCVARDVSYDGADPDDARLAAAEAVYPTLPADVQAELGVRP